MDGVSEVGELVGPIYAAVALIAGGVIFYLGVRVGHHYGIQGAEPPKIPRPKPKYQPPPPFLPKSEVTDETGRTSQTDGV